MYIRFLDSESLEFLRGIARGQVEDRKFELKRDDWPRIVQIIRGHGLPVILRRLEQCFGVEIFNHTRRNGVEPESIVCISEFSIPRAANISSVQMARMIATQLTFTPQNQIVLRFYGLKSDDEPHKCCY